MDLRIAVNAPAARVGWIVLLAMGCGRVKAASDPRPDSAVAQLQPPVLDTREVFPAGKVPVAGELRNPDAGDASAAKVGGQLFSAMNCDGCHGGGATGWVGPSLVDGRWRYGDADGNLFQSIYYGRPKGMPAYGGFLSREAIWQLVTYIRSQPAPPTVPTERWQEGKK